MAFELRPEWLGLLQEEILEPDRRIVDPHPHLICTECEKIEDLDEVEVENDGPLDSISAATGYHVTRRRVDYYGVCPNCQEVP